MNLSDEIQNIDAQGIVERTASFLKEKVTELHREGIALGLSGGLDSAAVAALCVRAVGKDKVLAIIMPEKDSGRNTVSDAVLVAKSLSIKYEVINIAPYLSKFGIYRMLPLRFIPGQRLRAKVVLSAFEYFKKKHGESPFVSGFLAPKDKYVAKGAAYYRIKHRLRMIMLYFLAEQKNLLVVGAANKTEAMTGFFVKYGIDDATDIMPIVHLYKTQVRILAKYLNVPEPIISKAPSPDIIPGIVDEYALGLPYEQLDLILLGLEKGVARDRIAQEVGCNGSMIEYATSLTEKSRHMREKPYVLKFKSNLTLNR